MHLNIPWWLDPLSLECTDAGERVQHLFLNSHAREQPKPEIKLLTIISHLQTTQEALCNKIVEIISKILSISQKWFQDWKKAKLI